LNLNRRYVELRIFYCDFETKTREYTGVSTTDTDIDAIRNNIRDKKVRISESVRRVNHVRGVPVISVMVMIRIPGPQSNRKDLLQCMWKSGVNFINFLREAFTHTDRKSFK